MPPPETAAFVLCIEDNEVRDQALLLIASIRAFAGRFADSEIFAVAPRAFLGVDPATREQLATMGVTYHEEPLNTACPWYGSANRLYAAAWAAAHSSADVLIVLDSDTLVLGEPDLPGDDIDLAVRPVGVKGCASSGADDPCEPYWRDFCALAGMPVSGLPWVETTVDRQIVRASYNGGYAAIRRRSGIAEHAANLFTRSLEAGLLPTAGNAARVVSSTGRVSSLASRYWGSNQAALSIAAWSTTRRVRLLDRRTNVPLHCLADAANWHDDWRDLRPLHVHYHWMLEPPHRPLTRELLPQIGVGPAQLAWIDTHAFAAPTPPEIAVGTPVRATAPSGATSGRQLVICGMHRSGASLVASVFQRAGVDVGQELEPASAENERGHLENQDVFRLHDAMLAAAGHNGLTGDRPLATPGASFEAHAHRLIACRAALPLWGFEDPRACLFLDFWERLLPAPAYLMLYRHPVDVMLSLWRHGSGPELWQDPWLAVRSWELHNHALLAFRTQHPERCFLAQVPAVTADLPGLVRRVSERFHFELRADGVGNPLAGGELAAQQDDSGPPWRDILADALDLYERLEQAADWPATASPAGAATPGSVAALHGRESRLNATLLYKLLGGTTPAAVPLGGERAAERSMGDASDRVAELERELAVMAAERAGIAAHRNELARALTAIETSRAFRLVRAWWDVRRRLQPAAPAWRSDPAAAPPRDTP
jgi:hypothetical protein